ncbi:lysophosphatidylcholine acyltransferase isoform X1 [Culicoides brevitarsis]|uniref:lysophosphatidylcholine acyltransferase isoform X1 n=1 Tax=Culicoides brevitarsis TaxID=469753 RepID=UPI00307B37F0
MLTIMTSSETERLTKSIKDEIIEEHGGKKDHDDYLEEDSTEIKNPFVHKVEWNDPYDKIRTAIFTVFVLPIRTICIVILLTISWILACIGLYGLSREDLKTKPIKGWRRKIQIIAASCMRTLYWTGSFHYIRYKGVRATPKQAPIVCAAPHTSFYDSILAIILGPSSVVAKSETADMSFFGKLIDYTQPIYVCREDPDSRHNTIKEINERANSKEDWSQILIFPEGTCTNRTSLIQFKPGAFYPGVPVQPVCVRYPNKTDTVTWTWDGPDVITLLWRTLTQMHTYCEIEFLPVYTPNEEEKKDARLFARNVQAVMAKSLGVPISDYSFEDCRLMNSAKIMKIPNCAAAADTLKLRKKLGMDQDNIEETLIDKFSGEKVSKVGLAEFASRLQLDTKDENTIKLFKLHRSSDKQVDFRDYLLCALFIITLEKPKIQLVELLFKLYGKSGEASQDIFYEIMKHVLKKCSKDKAEHIFQQIDKSKNGFLTFDDFHSFTRLNPEYTYLFEK